MKKSVKKQIKKLLFNNFIAQKELDYTKTRLSNLEKSHKNREDRILDLTQEIRFLELTIKESESKKEIDKNKKLIKKMKKEIKELEEIVTDKRMIDVLIGNSEVFEQTIYHNTEEIERLIEIEGVSYYDFE